jgi:hypothetical protein
MSGLLTDIGMVVANPAYDSNTTNIEVLNEAAYHGTVVWSFQQALMAGGLTRQLSFCGDNRSDVVDTYTPFSTTPPAWCNDTSFVQSLENAQQMLWTSIKGAVDGNCISFTHLSLLNSTSDIVRYIHGGLDLFLRQFDQSVLSGRSRDHLS